MGREQTTVMGHLLACGNKERVTMIKQKQRCKENVECVYVYILC